MNQELAQKLRDAGFPEQTRISAELNLHRYRPLSPMDAPSFPLLQELLEEVKDEIVLDHAGYTGIDGVYVSGWIASTATGHSVTEKEYADTPANRESGWAGKRYFHAYVDDSMFDIFFGKTPEEAVAKLYLALHSPSLPT